MLKLLDQKTPLGMDSNLKALFTAKCEQQAWF